MSKLPQLSWREVVKALTRAGFTVSRQRGSHLILVKGERIVPVPKHRVIKRGLLQAIMAEADLTREEFQRLLVEKKGKPRKTGASESTMVTDASVHNRRRPRDP